MGEPGSPTPICPRCGSEQRPAARFCDQCGARVSSAGQATQRLGAPGGPKGWREANLGLIGELARRIIGPAQAPRPDPLPADTLAEPPAALGEAPPGAVPVGEWGACGDYTLCVYRALRGVADDRRPAFVVEVGYRGAKSLPSSQYHWRLCDTQGYFYESGGYNGWFLGEHARRLSDTLVLPERLVRGWVAFVCPLDAPVNLLRFRVSYRSPAIREFALPEPEYRGGG